MITSLVIFIVFLALYYALELGKKVARGTVHKVGLGIHGKINKSRTEAREKMDADMRRLHDNPRDIFTSDK